jgi:hypothetical protein
MNSPVQNATIQYELQRCLRSPYLALDDSRRNRVADELAAAQQLFGQAQTSFAENDEATGLKEVWGAVYRAARALAYKAGYRVEQLHCLEVVLRAHYPTIGDEEIAEMRRAQELVGTRDVALSRAQQFLNKAMSLA